MNHRSARSGAGAAGRQRSKSRRPAAPQREGGGRPCGPAPLDARPPRRLRNSPLSTASRSNGARTVLACPALRAGQPVTARASRRRQRAPAAGGLRLCVAEVVCAFRPLCQRRSHALMHECECSRAAPSACRAAAPLAKNHCTTQGRAIAHGPSQCACTARMSALAGHWPCRAAGGRPAARLWNGETRRSGVGARSALRAHARRACSSAANAVRVASCAARPRSEHRSAVGAQRRPSQ